MSRFHRQTLEHALAANSIGPSEWPSHTVPELLDLLRTGCKRFVSRKLSEVNIEDADLQLERSITALIYYEIDDLLHEQGGFASYRVTHEMWEFETLDPKSNRPPQYDIVFAWKGNEHLRWPCEAKVLRTDKNVAPYLSDITESYLKCIYAPYSNSGAMLGLLIQGEPNGALNLIAEKLGSTSKTSASYTRSSMMQTDHVRQVPKGKSYPKAFSLHHLMLRL